MIVADMTGLRIPEGEVVRIASGGVTLWEAGPQDYREVYQRVEYLATVGGDDGGYIITDFVGNDSSGMELTAEFDSLVDQVPMGSTAGVTNTRFYTPYPLSAYTVYQGWNEGKSNSLKLTVDTKYRLQSNMLNCRYACVYNAAGTRLMNTALSATLTQQTGPIAIFCYRNGGTGGMGARRPMRVFGAKCSQGSEVVREYIPCYRKSDGVAGMYETYTGQFLTTPEGGFTAGPDVDWEG